MIGIFFKEMFYLDQTRNGKYFLCHARTKHREAYNTTLQVFILGDHPVVGTSFTFEALMNLSDVQLPLITLPEKSMSQYNLTNYRDELLIMEGSGIKRHIIAEICNVHRATVSKILDKSP